MNQEEEIRHIKENEVNENIKKLQEKYKHYNTDKQVLFILFEKLTNSTY